MCTTGSAHDSSMHLMDRLPSNIFITHSKVEKAVRRLSSIQVANIIVRQLFWAIGRLKSPSQALEVLQCALKLDHKASRSVNTGPDRSPSVSARKYSDLIRCVQYTVYTFHNEINKSLYVSWRKHQVVCSCSIVDGSTHLIRKNP
jgi:hypothetical protein